VNAKDDGKVWIAVVVRSAVNAVKKRVMVELFML
jgi:hypothetical protein